MQKKVLTAWAAVAGCLALILAVAISMQGREARKAPVAAPMATAPAPAPNELKPRSPEPKLWYQEASKLAAQGDRQGAVKAFDKILEKYPESGEAESSLYALAAIYEARGELVRAREMLERLLEKFPASASVEKAKSELDRMRVKMLFSPVPDPDSVVYEVRSGDTLGKIAKKMNTTVDLLMKTNGLKDGSVKAGRKLKVTKLSFAIEVDKSQNVLTLLADNRVFKTYPVATGLNNCSPAGTFKVVNKVVDPVWYAQDAVVLAGSPKNILGSRWMGISQPGYGIHGSTDPSSIGKQATAGCVRMHNNDVEELYAIVPIGTEVVIEE